MFHCERDIYDRLPDGKAVDSDMLVSGGRSTLLVG